MKILWILVTALLSVTTMAQTPEPLFDPKNESLVGTQMVHVFDGKPAVLIEPIPGVISPPANPAERLPPPTLSSPVFLTIKTPFGHDGTAAYVNQITDRIVWVRILDADTIHVTEQIQQVVTETGEPWERTFHTDGADIEIQSLTRNDRHEVFDLHPTTQGLKIRPRVPFGKGIQNIVLDYVLRGALASDSSTAELKLPLTESNLPHMTERMTVIVLMPKPAPFYVQELLFGSNRIAVPDQYRLHSDIKGNLIFQMQHPLPARAAVWLHLIFDATALGSPHRLLSTDIQIGLIFGVIWLGYVLLSVGECRFKKDRNPLRTAHRISPLLAAAFLGGLPISDPKRTESRWAGLIRHPIVLTILAFFRFCGEYIIGITLLNLGVRLTARHWHFDLSDPLLTLAGFLSLSGLFLIYFFGARFRVFRLCRQIRQALMTTPEGMTPAPRSIPLYDTWASVLGFDREWHKVLIANNPSFQKRFLGD